MDTNNSENNNELTGSSFNEENKVSTEIISNEDINNEKSNNLISEQINNIKESLKAIENDIKEIEFDADPDAENIVTYNDTLIQMNDDNNSNTKSISSIIEEGELNENKINNSEDNIFNMEKNNILYSESIKENKEITENENAKEIEGFLIKNEEELINNDNIVGNNNNKNEEDEEGLIKEEEEGLIKEEENENEIKEDEIKKENIVSEENDKTKEDDNNELEKNINDKSSEENNNTKLEENVNKEKTENDEDKENNDDDSSSSSDSDSSDSDSSESDSSSDFDTDSDSDDSDDSDDDILTQDKVNNIKKKLNKFNEMDDDEDDGTITLIHSTHELTVLPKVKAIDIQIPPDLPLQKIGIIQNIVDEFVLVQAVLPGNYQVLDEDSILLFANRKPLGRVSIIFILYDVYKNKNKIKINI